MSAIEERNMLKIYEVWNHDTYPYGENERLRMRDRERDRERYRERQSRDRETDGQREILWSALEMGTQEAMEMTGKKGQDSALSCKLWRSVYMF